MRERGDDSTDVEVKLGVGGVPRVGETLCAFGNMPNGGTLIIGLDEANDFESIGAVSYTHLDVYKRQSPECCGCAWYSRTPGRHRNGRPVVGWSPGMALRGPSPPAWRASRKGCVGSLVKGSMKVRLGGQRS